MSPFLNVLLLSAVASLGTGLGGLLAVLRKPGKRSFGLLMGGTAGVMLTLSFMDLVSKAWEMAGYLTATIGFAAGALFLFAIDYIAPHIRFGEREMHLGKGTDIELPGYCENPARCQRRGGWQRWNDRVNERRHLRRGRNHINDRKLFRTGVLIAIGIAIHNMPEGIAVGAGFMHEPRFGYFIAAAIALHNIPEGIATALPLCKSGVCRWDAFKVALFSGLTEPIGAVLAMLVLNIFQGLIPASLAFAGGVMTFITLDELLPAAREYGHQHYTALGIIIGAVFVFLLSGIFGV